MLEPRTVSTTYIRTLLGTVEANGVKADLVLQGLPVDRAQLAIPAGRVGIGLARAIWDRALALTGDPLLGLKVAEDMRPNTFRLLGLVTMSCASLEQAISMMLRYQRLVSESGTLTAHAQPDGAIALIHTAQKNVRLRPQQIEAVIGGVCRQARRLAEHDFLPQAVSFRHAALGALPSYRHCFGIEPEFEADADMIVFAACDLQAPLPDADAELCRMHCEAADRQLQRLPQIGFVTSFAVQWLAAQVIGAARIEDLAEALGLSMRSLQRAMQEEGKSWTALVDEARRESLGALLEQGLSLDEAAQRMGYHDASSVSRAARRWFGMTAGQWRLRQHKASRDLLDKTCK